MLEAGPLQAGMDWGGGGLSMKLLGDVSTFKKNKTIDTPKIVNILFNVSTSFQSSSGMTLLKNTEIYIYKLSGSNYALIKYHKFLRGSISMIKFRFLAMYMYMLVLFANFFLPHYLFTL